MEEHAEECRRVGDASSAKRLPADDADWEDDDGICNRVSGNVEMLEINMHEYFNVITYDRSASEGALGLALIVMSASFSLDALLSMLTFHQRSLSTDMYPRLHRKSGR